MRTRFTASNGVEVEARADGTVVCVLAPLPVGRRVNLRLSPPHLQALVEYAATIGITAEARPNERKRVRHFAPYGSTNATCGEDIPAGAVPPIAGNSGIYSSPRFTTRRAETTCPDCRAIANITDEEASA